MPDVDACDVVSTFTLNVRSYAPFVSFGGGFEGDNRGPTTSSTVTSRIATRVAFNPQSGEIGKPASASSGTVFLPLNTRAMAEPASSLTKASRLPNGFVIMMDISGSNPLVPGAPDIDLHVYLRVTLSPGRLNSSLSLRGDQFPNAEMFYTDGFGRSRMLLTFETAGGRHTGPAVYLPGDGWKPMNSLCITHAIDAQGRFL